MEKSLVLSLRFASQITEDVFFHCTTVTTSMWMAPNGNIGINSLNPTAKLDVRGSLAIIDNSSDTTYDALAYIENQTSSAWGLKINKGNIYLI